MAASESFDISVCLKMLLQITLLRKCRFTSFHSAGERSLIRMASEVIKKFVKTGKNLATIIIEVTFKESILFFIFFTLFEIIELEVLAVRNVALEAQVILNINLFSICDIDCVMGLYLILSNEFRG